MFIPKPDCVLVDADYSQIELRVLAHIAGRRRHAQGVLRSCGHPHGYGRPGVRRAGGEGHAALAAPPCQGCQFRHCLWHFGVLSGGGYRGFRYEARAYIDNYLNNYRGVKEYMHKVVADAREIGYTETLYGRRRYIPELKSKAISTSAAVRSALR